MSEAQESPARFALNAANWRAFVEGKALAMVKGAMRDDEAKKIASQTALAFATVLRTARDPSAFLSCTMDSILSAIAMAVATRLPPGGPAAVSYLVPQSPRKGAPMELQFRVSHRGYITLALREGIRVRAVPVGFEDEIAVINGEVTLTQNLDSYPESAEQLRGVAIFVRLLASDIESSTWVPASVIGRRRRMSRTTSGPWDDWAVEMALGASIRYAVARGDVPVYSVEMQSVMEAEDRQSIIDAESVPTPAKAGARAALGLVEDAPDFAAQAEALRREPEPVATVREEDPTPATQAAPAPAPTGGVPSDSEIVALQEELDELAGDRAHRSVKDSIRKVVGYKPFTDDERRAYVAALREAITAAEPQS